MNALRPLSTVRQRGSKRLFIDWHMSQISSPYRRILIFLKSDAYKSGSIIFQDKASCFPAYLLDPLAEDGNIIDTCAAPGNKTTHIAAILLSHNAEPDECSQVIHAFEKTKGRAETLEKMVSLAGSGAWTKLHPRQDFLKTDPKSAAFKNVGALLLDPSCSGSGIIGRDDMPELHLPAYQASVQQHSQAPE
jgi:putative methyltransferase